MCVGFYSLEHPDYAVILCSNRDETLSRPTLNAHFHSFGHVASLGEGETVLSGRDAQAGGTWLGINRAGRIALLTNITTEGTTTFTTSRGHLVSSFLLSHPSHDPLATIDTPDAKYAGFNLLLLSPSPSTDQTESLSYDGFFITNAGPGGPITSRPLTPDERRCGSISNGVCAPGAPACDWPKVKHGIDTLHRILFDTIVAPTVTTRNGTPESVEEAEGRLVEDLFDLLTWRSDTPPHTRSELPNTIQVDPFALGPTGHVAATAAAPPAELFGTRLSSILLVRRSGHVLFVERDIWTLGQDEGRTIPLKADPRHQSRSFSFHIPI